MRGGGLPESWSLVSLKFLDEPPATWRSDEGPPPPPPPPPPPAAWPRGSTQLTPLVNLSRLILATVRDRSPRIDSDESENEKRLRRIKGDEKEIAGCTSSMHFFFRLSPLLWSMRVLFTGFQGSIFTLSSAPPSSWWLLTPTSFHNYSKNNLKLRMKCQRSVANSGV